MQALVLAGIPPAAALKMATINGARALRTGRRQLGTIEAGKLADLFVVRGNPLQDITNTRNVRLVMARGVAPRRRRAARVSEGQDGTGDAGR